MKAEVWENMETNDEYWDCECQLHFIHKLENGNYCSLCNCHANDMPSSIQKEIDELYSRINDRFLEVKK